MIGDENMTPQHWAVYDKIISLLSVAKATPVETMDDISEEFGVFRVPDTHPHAPDEFAFALVLNLEVPSNHRVAAENETPLRFTLVKHGAAKSGFIRALPPGGQEWVPFPALNTMHLNLLEPLVDTLVESYPELAEEMTAQGRKKRADAAVAELIEALHNHGDYQDAEIELLETLTQVFHMSDSPGRTPVGSAYARMLRKSALEIAKVTLDRLRD